MAGPAAEALYCGAIDDGCDGVDIDMARRHLLRGGFEPLRLGAELARCRAAADRWVRTEWARDRIERIANLLLGHGSLRDEVIGGLLGDTAAWLST